MLSLFQNRFRCRDDQSLILPYAGDYELAVSALTYLHDGLAEYGRIADLIFSNECIVRGCICLFACALGCEDFSENDHAYDHAEQTERICYCARHGHVIGCICVVRAHLQQCLLSGSEHRGVGDRSGKQTDGVWCRCAGGPEYNHSHERSCYDKGECQQVKFHASMLE